MSKEPKLPADTRLLIYAMGVFQKYDLAKGWLAKDRNGLNVCTYNKRAVSFCAVGALCRAVSDLGLTAADKHKAIARFAKAISRSIIPEWNDRPRRTKAEVIAAFKKAALSTVGDK